MTIEFETYMAGLPERSRVQVCCIKITGLSIISKLDKEIVVLYLNMMFEPDIEQLTRKQYQSWERARLCSPL